MNLLHRWICSSSHWKEAVEKQIFPWTLHGVDLGADVLEVGPGYGAVTALLQSRVARLTCVEVDPKLAAALRKRTTAPNVKILCEDATRMTLPDASFDAAVSFTMLHHVPSVALQDRLLAEVARVLRPGGIFAGTDNLDSRAFRVIHAFDTLVPVDPEGLPERLRAAGFDRVEVKVNPRAFRFRARRTA
jgi:SAM-dependent methyltransferase